MTRFGRVLSITVRAAAGAVALRRLAGAATAAPPVRPLSTPRTSIDVVIPARDEATRIGPLLASIVGAPGVGEVIVVDDRSSDGTADTARAAGARVVAGVPRPDGWAGKAWALQQGIEAATADWVVTLDADVRPDPQLPTAIVSRAIGERLDLVTMGGRFECPTPAGRWLHAAMLTTLVYRYGPPGVPTGPERSMANGQCMAFRRADLLDAERFDTAGLAAVRGEVVEDVAIARHLAANGAKVAFLDGSDVLTVRMFESLGDTWRGWGRSLALPGVEPRRRQLADLAVIVLAQALPIPRLLLGRADVIDVALLAGRVGTLLGTRRAYTRNDAAYWLSPLADLPAAVAIALGIRRGTRQSWRGRTYP